MAVTLAHVGEVSPDVFGGLRVAFVDITGPASYTTGGEALAPADIGFSQDIFFLVGEGGGYILQYDRTNDKILYYWGPTSAGALPQVDSATNLSGVTIRAFCVGR